MTASPTLDSELVVVQVARTLPASDSGWRTTTRLENPSGSWGLGPVIGEAVLEQTFGVRTDAGTRRWLDLGEAPNFGRQADTGSINDTLAGAVVRLLRSDTSGTVVLGGRRFTAFWWGICRGPASEPDGDESTEVAGLAKWNCAGIESVLDQVTIAHGYTLSVISGLPVRLGFCPPFNANSQGDRSGSTYDLPGGTVYLPLLSAPASFSWTARQILDHLLAVHMRDPIDGGDAPTGWAWTVSDPDGCLAYEPEETDVNGLTVFQAINLLASQDRGCTWYVTVSGDTATINIISTSAEEVTFGDVTVPASTYTATLDLRGDPYLGGCTITEDWDSVYDDIEVHGARPWRALTLLLDSSHDVLLGVHASAGGWTALLETLWDTDPDHSGTENVYRRFALATGWNGQQYNDSGEGLRNALLTNAAGGLTGAREYDPAQGIAPAWMLEFTRLLPCSAHFGAGASGDRQMPVVVVGSAGDWTDKSQDWQLQLSSDGKGSPPYVRIDDGRQGQDIQTHLDAGEQILITVGIREIDPLQVSWHRPASERPNATRRRKVQRLPQCEEWTVCPGTVRGVTTDGTDLDTTSVEIVARDDKPKMEAALALLVAGLSQPSVSVTWSYHGTLDISSTWRPGRLLTTVTRGDKTQTVNSVITRRSWQHVVERAEGLNGEEVGYYVTTYQTQRLPPSLEALL